MTFNFDSWLYGQIDAYCNQPDTQKRYVDNLYRVFWNDSTSSWYDDYTEEEIKEMYEDEEEPEQVEIYRLVEEYIYLGDGDIEVIDTTIDDEPVYKGML